LSNIGFIGIAVALLGRNTAVGVGLAALLFGALLTGTSTRSLDPEVFPPQLAGNLALMIQALVLLFVGADLLILYIWQARRKLRLPGTSLDDERLRVNAGPRTAIVASDDAAGRDRRDRARSVCVLADDSTRQRAQPFVARACGLLRNRRRAVGK